MELAALIAGVASAIALTGTLLLVARQARSLASQTELANKLAVHSATTDSMKGIRSIFLVFVDHPELRPYFFENVELPEAAESEQDDALRARVLTIGELLADTLERAIESTRSVGAPDRDRDAWEDATDYHLAQSPALRTTITSHTTWWPSVTDRLRNVPSARSED